MIYCGSVKTELLWLVFVYMRKCRCLGWFLFMVS